MGQPLDKSTAAFYGKFVNAAYAMFKRDPNNLEPEPQPGDIPAPYEMVAWINMSVFFARYKETRFYGLISQNTQVPHEYILAIRGTEGLVEWWDDATSFLVPFRQVPDAGRVHEGFDRIYSSMRIVKRLQPAERVAAKPPVRTFVGSFSDQLEGLTVGLEASRKAARDEKRGRPLRTYVVTGHSLGSALATLFVMENDEKKRFDVTTCCTFASPRVGNKKFCLRFNRLPITSWRIVNSRDLVPKVPLWIPPFFGYRHVETAYKFSCRGTVRSSLGCWHSLRTYLHWLDPTVRLDAECVDLLGSGEEPTTDLLKFVASNLAVRFSDLAKRFADHDPRDLRALVYDAASSGLVTIRSAEGEDFIVSIAADGSKRLQSQSWRTGWARFLGTILR